MTPLSTSDVLDRHLNSFAKYDLDGILADYSSDAVLFTPAGPLRGRAAIKPLFATLVSEFAKPGSSFTMGHGCNRHHALALPNAGETLLPVRDMRVSGTAMIRNSSVKFCSGVLPVVVSATSALA